jgi:hypothetical protein
VADEAAREARWGNRIRFDKAWVRAALSVPDWGGAKHEDAALDVVGDVVAVAQEVF